VSTFVGVEQLYDELDDRTRAILARRQGVGVVRRRGWFVSRSLLVADITGLVIAFVLAQDLYAIRIHPAGTLSQLNEFLVFVLSLPVWVVAARLYGLYDKDEERADHSTADEFVRVFHLLTVCTFLLYAVSLLTDLFNPEFSKLLVFWLLAIVATMTLRALARSVCRRHISYLQNTIIVGAGEVGQTIALKLLKHREYGLNLVGFVDSQPKDRFPELEHLALLGDPEDLLHLIELLDVERVILAFSNEAHEETLALLRRLGNVDVQVDIVPRLFDGLGPRLSIHPLEGIPLLSLPPLRLTPTSMLLKRATDIVIASVALILAAPVLALIAAVLHESGGSVLFRSERIGRHGVRFKALKFRTMQDRDPEEDLSAEIDRLLQDPLRRAEFERTHKFTDDPRITRLGKWLRKSSLDELPQLWNVLRGEISIVGPRPITAEEFDMLGAEKLGRGYWSITDLRPGLTGYWQINGRSEMDYSDRIRLDTAYLTGWSLGLDLTIIAKTFRVLTLQRGAY
jgi:exopolysaccharide biosynthesis polyprenyl glycosylphosphotransferase